MQKKCYAHPFTTLAYKFVKKGEAYLNELNAKIEALEQSKAFIKAKLRLEELKLHSEKALEDFKQNAKKEKQLRRQKRVEAEANLSKIEQSELLETLKEESIQMF